MRKNWANVAHLVGQIGDLTLVDAKGFVHFLGAEPHLLAEVVDGAVSLLAKVGPLTGSELI